MRYLPASCSKAFGIFLLQGFVATLMIAQSPLRSAQAVPGITQAIDESNLVTLKGSVSPLATSAADQGEASDSLQLGRTMLVLKSTPARQNALNKLVDDQQNPKSPSYHAWLKPEQYGEQFGVATQDVQKITQWLVSHGFSVEAPIAGHNLIIFSGTHAQLKAAFHTSLHRYKVHGESYFANASDPQIPAALASVVTGFSSLNNFPRNALHTKPELIRRDKSTWQKASAAGKGQAEFTTTYNNGTYYVVAPYDLATIYNIKPLWDAGIDGTGETIAIVSDSNINPADVDYFRAAFGLPAKKLNIFTYGPDPGVTGDEGEADLDVQWSGAVAKNATIDLVVAGDSATSGGIDGAAAYIINNNLATILNVSYGECESVLGTAGNAYYNMLWEQAASQGITVLVSSGDSGPAACDQNQPYEFSGLRVSGISSTPYNVSVGGTDFHSTYVDPNKYWNATNDPTTLASVKGYLPESTWNDSCANPQVLAALQANGNTDATLEALCNDANETQWLNTAAGSGGRSNCAVAGADATIPCLSGYPKPAWQSGVTGIPTDGVRDLPDVSLMAGNGLWGSFYPYCQSDLISGGACDVNNSLEGAGGTSFASPVFAGIMALLQQKTASQQGNVNYVLYKLAAAQYAGSNASACDSSTVAAGNSCMFYDITEGTIAVPCFAGYPDCPAPPAGDTIGIMPEYETTAGYDLATGLGSINAYNLVEGWNSAASNFLPTTVSLAATNTATAVYGASLNVNVSVAPVAPATGVPSGDVGITTNSATPGNFSVGDTTLNGALGSLAAAGLPVGTYDLFARYAGDASFAPSKSTGLSVTITKATLSGVLSSTRASVLPGQKVTFSVAMTGVSTGVNPTGTVTFTNTTTGVVLGSENLAVSAPSAAGPVSNALVTVASTQLQLGTDNISASYSGDTNYVPSNVAPLAVTLTGPFTTTVSAPSLLLAPNAAGSVTVTVTPVGQTVLVPTALNFSCPATMPAGLTCSFSTPVAGAGGVVNSTLTLQASAPLYTSPKPVAENRPSRGGGLATGFGATLAGLVMLALPRRRRNLLMLLAVMAFSSIAFIGCSGGGNTQAAPAAIATTTTLSVTPLASSFGTPSVFTAKVVAASGVQTPSGTVTFLSAGTTLGTGTLASGMATMTTSLLPVGPQTVTASYGGDPAYTGSTSAPVSLDISFTSAFAITASDIAGDTSSANVAVTIQ
jgi:subtilase family serine protease